MTDIGGWCTLIEEDVHAKPGRSDDMTTPSPIGFGGLSPIRQKLADAHIIIEEIYGI